METTKKVGKSASIGLKAQGSRMRIVARCRPDGSAITLVATTDAEKKTVRGMTEQHATFADAKAALATLAAKAQKLGWERGTAGYRAKPDAFTTMPAAPKQVKK